MIKRVNVNKTKYKHQPTSPRVLIIDPEDPRKLFLAHPDNTIIGTLPLGFQGNSGAGTSPAAVGQGGPTLTKGGWLFSPEPAVETKPLAQADETDVFGDPTPHNKFWVLVALGFAPVQKSVWYNKKLGIEISFDIEKEELETLAFLIHHRGTLKGAQRLKEQFKLILDL